MDNPIRFFTATNEHSVDDVAKATGTETENSGVFELEHLVGLTKWASAGFVALSGIVTFFGLQTGALDRIVAEDPSAVLGVFVLVGLGVVASLFARATNPKVAVLTGWVFALLALLVIYVKVLLSSNYLPDVPRIAWISAFAIVIGLTALAAKLRWRLALPATLLVAATALISLGLFVAVNVSVAAKKTSEALRVSASVTTSEGAHEVKVNVKGDRQLRRVGRVVVQAVGLNASGAEITRSLGSARFHADAANKVEETFIFPVDGDWTKELVVSACTGIDCSMVRYARIRFGGAETPPTLTGDVSRSDKTVKATLKVLHLHPGQSVRFQLTSRGVPVAAGVLHPDDKGSADFSGAVPSAATDPWSLSARTCADTCGPQQELAAVGRTR